jgi:hypothetical protein
MTAPLTQEQNLLFHSYFTVSLLVELKNNSLLDSDYYKGMPFGAPWIKNELQKIGIDNQGCAMMTLYAMLVIPREIVQQAYASEYDKINTFLQTHTQNTNTTYRSDSQSVNHLRHIRNAVAHARVEFRPTDVIIFNDENRHTKETFSTELPLKHLGKLVHELQMVHIAYIQDLQNSTETKLVGSS